MHQYASWIVTIRIVYNSPKITISVWKKFKFSNLIFKVLH